MIPIESKSTPYELYVHGQTAPRLIHDAFGLMMMQGWYDLATSSEEQENTLRLPDLGTICLGYMVMSAMVFMWRGIINAISDRINTQILLRAKKAMRVIAAVVKVGLLLSLKMLLLPLLLGVCLDATTLPLFGCAAEARARFMAQHLVGSLLLHWVRPTDRKHKTAVCVGGARMVLLLI